MNSSEPTGMLDHLLPEHYGIHPLQTGRCNCKWTKDQRGSWRRRRNEERVSLVSPWNLWHVTFQATQTDMRERVTFWCWTGEFTGLLKQRSYIMTVTQHLGACLTASRKKKICFFLSKIQNSIFKKQTLEWKITLQDNPGGEVRRELRLLVPQEPDFNPHPLRKLSILPDFHTLDC